MMKDDLATPALVVDKDVLSGNIVRMSEIAKSADVKLRPHIKTHKTPAIAKMQLESGAVGITCAKVSEAEVMQAAGIKDILIAYPVVGDEQVYRALSLATKAHITMAFDSAYGAQKINHAANRFQVVVPLYMIVNTGLDRDGVLPGPDALELARQIKHLEHVVLKGIMTHEGHVYHAKDLQELTQVAKNAGLAMVQTRDLLVEHGFPIDEVSMGSTPVCRAGITVAGVTEWRPGTYVFNDEHEVMMGVARAECALSVVATVVSHPAKNRFILDAGSKVLTTDRSMTKGYGYIKEVPDAVIVRLSEEHAVVEAVPEGVLRIGDRVEIIPNHVCPVVNLADALYMTQGDEIKEVSTVTARGKVT
jgi:D-serine deaminase-like pyridoxal phosphate-dependent protein